MQDRKDLHKILVEILGSNNVYYQPPTTVRMKYPAIRYSRNNIRSIYADDTSYIGKISYTVTLIDYDPDSKCLEKLAALPLCRHDRHYTADNLNHDTFNIYF